MGELGLAEMRKIFAIAMGAGIDPNCFKIRKARDILNDRMASSVLNDAQKMKESDDEAVKKGNIPKYGQATAAAEKIEKQISACIEEGCADCHPKLEQSRLLAKMLYQVDGERKRLAARENR